MWVFVLCFATAIANSASTVGDSISRECGIDENQPPLRTFANPEGKNTWREYRSVKDAPEIQSFGQLAELWAGSEGKTFILLEEPSEDWATYTGYCYNKIGQLMALRFEVRTAWGWGYREDGPIVTGILSPKTATFFNTSNDASIEKPEQAAEVADALKPSIYARKSRLPFAKLLRR